MGISGGIFLIAIGAILAFAVRANIAWLDLQVVGWVLIFAGIAVLSLTIYFWQQRRTRQYTLVEESLMRHSPDRPTLPEAPDAEMPPGSGHNPMV